MKQARLIGEIGGQAMDVIRTQGEIAGLKAQKDPAALSQAGEQLEREAKGKPVSDAAVMKQAYDNAMQQYGTGSDLQKATQAVTGALTALAGNNLAVALANGASPYLATEIKKRVGEDNIAANAMAYAVLGAVTAQLNTQSALAGGLGAGGGELAARVIIGQLFPGKTVEQLSESEKQQVSALSQLAAGLAGGLATGDTAGAVTGVQAGKNAVENNYLSYDEAHAFDKEMTACRKSGRDCGDIQNKYAVISADNRQKLHIDVAADPLTALSGEDKWNIEGGLSAAGRPGWLYGSLENQDVKNYVTEGNNYDLNYLNSNTSKGDKALAFFGEPENYWGTVAGAGSLLISSATLTEKVISAGLSYGANGLVQLSTGNTGDKFDYLSFMMSGLTGAGTVGKGYYANQLLGAGNAYMTSQIEGQDSTASVVGSMAGTGVGYNAGAAITNKLESQYIKNQLGMDASKYSLEYSEKAIGPGYIYQGGKMSSAPGIIGGGVGNGLSEASGNAVQNEAKER